MCEIRRQVVFVLERSPEQEVFRLSFSVTCLSAGSFAGAGGAEADRTQRVSGVFPDRKGNSSTCWFEPIMTQQTHTFILIILLMHSQKYLHTELLKTADTMRDVLVHTH